MSKTWFITGASRGLGRAFTQAALERGDRVAATVRAPGALKDLAERHPDSLLALRLDVTDRAACFAAVNAAHAEFGRLDVVVNNAGYGLFGTVEAVTEEAARAQMDTNFFGALWVTQAALPHLRAQGAGHIVQVSSVAGIATFPLLSVYHASKWALEGMSETLAQEVATFGIRVTLLEPGPFRTDWAGDSAHRVEDIAAYDEPLAPFRTAYAADAGREPGDPARAAAALLTLVDAPEPPLRVLMGNLVADGVPGLYQERLRTWAEWEELARSVDFPEAVTPPAPRTQDA
ncbi:SDR family oxidoreductase [Allostreptomyces psammosilenae]|uniref:NAD(P)-dependent dehydrogenase (Short-subunit alcohol dehydrogenase family) n=1 Tax=Allostreptomyces psammosilenae TaxID=1892865 RepID=A0A852ZZT1_9ACTN|nr:SDR family oxidoreductase [Allostreptomyces psammosilenae]NYI07347.1 NAD(P)-dependent dehydrogenase (short-subunit alcohol dehydrogenase family) [Allostreptomyces psammosilenae]